MRGLPEKGLSRDEIASLLRERKQGDVDWAGGRTFGLVYNAGDEVTEVLRMASEAFGMTNALNPMAFPSLREMESEVLSIATGLLNGAEAVGSITTGGTESILMAVHAAREHARADRPGIGQPELVAPITAHPAFEKAAHYLGVRTVRTPVCGDYRADLDAMQAALGENTILVVGSAPGYPHGVIDPITEIAAMAQARSIPCHVDACLGGYLLPFLERLGYPVPPFDFRVEGVTSISADLHKYGYAAKGASSVMYRDRSMRKRQFFAYGDWPGGIYASPTMTGARGGGPIAAAWAVFQFLGEEGYLSRARDAMEAARGLRAGIDAMDGIGVLGSPDMTVFAFAARDLDAYALGDALDRRGWCLDRMQLPPGLHMMASPVHRELVGPFLEDLGEAVEEIRLGDAPEGGAGAVYGMLATLPDRGQAARVAIDLLDGLG